MACPGLLSPEKCLLSPNEKSSYGFCLVCLLACLLVQGLVGCGFGGAGASCAFDSYKGAVEEEGVRGLFWLKERLFEF